MEGHRRRGTHSLEFEDGFADDAGNPNLDLPVTKSRVSLDGQADGRTVMTIETTFPSPEAMDMDQMAEMGMEEGLRAALSQIDDILATGAAA